MKKILSIDGGGIRGVIPARFLAALEAQAGKPCSELFDLIAGTSTGGILALGLVAPEPSTGKGYPASDLVDLYRRAGPSIFHRTPEHIALTMGGIDGPKYPANGIESVLKIYFGDLKIEDALKPVVVTTYDTVAPSEMFPRSWVSKDLLMREAARATSAAPTYFDPLESDGHFFVDGGVFANNPAVCAWTFGRSELGWPSTEDVLVVSLGTGNTEQSEFPKGWGLVRWAPHIVTVIMDGGSGVVDLQLRALLPSERYFRFQSDLSGGVSQAMDDASPETIAALISKADAMVERNAAQIESLVGLLTS